MNIGQLPDENELKRLFIHYKNFYVSFGILLICIVLIFGFIFPEVQNYSDQRAQFQEVQEKINTLEQNIAVISRVNEQQQGDDLKTVISALPQDKDYAGILYAVNAASSKTNVRIGDFSFSVGELSSKAVITRNTPYLSLRINVSGDTVAISNFLTELAKTLPLSAVNEIALNSSFADIKVDFYYKPLAQLQVNYAQPIVPLSKNNQELLETLRSWQDSGANFDVSAPDASASASPFGQ